ncbi:MAG: ferrous iron transport protein B [Candidatus Omnitrophica bacterium 4484_70.2]|nr:MAG: ferrous iron transport protein B [Candidatus Omnitrophica bacterium 4484_70.2]
MPKKLTIALAGNPNSGKTTVFNNLTGARQHVGNYPGVTVEKKEGTLRYKDYEINVVDLPGTYSLTAYSIDELVARNFVIEEKPDVVIDIIDTSNLERNLYLATQFMELGVPLVLAFNMYDLAQKQGLNIDKHRLSQLLGCPIVFTVATKKQGMDELLDEAINLVEGKTKLRRTNIGYGREIEEELKKIEEVILKDRSLTQKYPSKWLAVKSLEDDTEIIKKLKGSVYSQEILTQVERSAKHLEKIFGDTPQGIIADRRYGFISGACSEAVKKTYEVRHSISDKIDKVLLNKILGLPIFLGLMWLVFKFTFKLSEPLMGWIEASQTLLGNLFSRLLPEERAIHSLVVDGIISGVGSVLMFVPIIFLLFLAIAVLEDSGYMARAAFIMDRFMHKIGLHGRSFISMLLGFGCNLPAIMATRTIEDRRDRLVTILVNPFMSCGARLPVYALFIGAFFSQEERGNVLFSLYLLGIIVAVLMAKLFRKYLFKGEASPFVMELPPYRVPTIKGLFIHMWERGVVYLKKAGSTIFLGCILIWFLSNFPWRPQYSKDYDVLIKQAQGNKRLVSQLEKERASEKLEKSYAGRLGRAIVPVFKPLGFDDWKICVGLIGGFVAKEIVVGTLGTLYSISEADEESESLRIALQREERPDGSKMYNPLVAYALMVFILLYMPCVATVAVIKKETNSWKWPLFTVFYTTTIAWIVSFVIYQTGRLLGWGM